MEKHDQWHFLSIISIFSFSNAPFFLEFIQIVRYIYIHTYWKCRSIPLIKIFTRRIVAPYNFPSMVKKKKERERNLTLDRPRRNSYRPVDSIIFKERIFHATKKIVLRSSSCCVDLFYFFFLFLFFDTIDLPYIIISIKYTLGLSSNFFFSLNRICFPDRQSSCYTPARTGWTERADTLNATAPSLHHCVSAS